ARDQANAILDELGRAASRRFHSRDSQNDIQRLLQRGMLTTIFDRIINENNRFGLRLHHESPNFVRAGQLFMVLVDSLDCKFTVMPDVFKAVIDQVESDHAVLEGAKRFRDADRAMGVVAAWLDRVSMKDPALFSKLQGHIRGAAHA
ncbi:MAG TPA: hypothetical protein VIF43_04295, partial [Patescibacteria group bacterium]